MYLIFSLVTIVHLDIIFRYRGTGKRFCYNDDPKASSCFEYLSRNRLLQVLCMIAEEMRCILSVHMWAELGEPRILVIGGAGIRDKAIESFMQNCIDPDT